MIYNISSDQGMGGTSGLDIDREGFVMYYHFHIVVIDKKDLRRAKVVRAGCEPLTIHDFCRHLAVS